ncbi:hypothetical protein DAI22_05g218414 [Oryza sativa Japonica Group]|nr:hypothetical protein DAI22_05g218414 [Oryza sativa Japonica Group]
MHVVYFFPYSGSHPLSLLSLSPFPRRSRSSTAPLVPLSLPPTAGTPLPLRRRPSPSPNLAAGQRRRGAEAGGGRPRGGLGGSGGHRSWASSRRFSTAGPSAAFTTGSPPPHLLRGGRRAMSGGAVVPSSSFSDAKNAPGGDGDGAGVGARRCWTVGQLELHGGALLSPSAAPKQRRRWRRRSGVRAARSTAPLLSRTNADVGGAGARRRRRARWRRWPEQ